LRELSEQSHLQALATHDPEKLQEAFAGTSQSTADVDPDAMRGWKEDD
jgi:hypothetical protein